MYCIWKKQINFDFSRYALLLHKYSIAFFSCAIFIVNVHQKCCAYRCYSLVYFVYFTIISIGWWMNACAPRKRSTCYKKKVIRNFFLIFTAFYFVKIVLFSFYNYDMQSFACFSFFSVFGFSSYFVVVVVFIVVNYN